MKIEGMYKFDIAFGNKKIRREAGFFRGEQYDYARSL